MGTSDNQTERSTLFKLCTFAVFMLNTCVFLLALRKGKIFSGIRITYFSSKENGDQDDKSHGGEKAGILESNLPSYKS